MATNTDIAAVMTKDNMTCDEYVSLYNGSQRSADSHPNSIHIRVLHSLGRVAASPGAVTKAHIGGIIQLKEQTEIQFNDGVKNRVDETKI
jgi:hypothetical protein